MSIPSHRYFSFSLLCVSRTRSSFDSTFYRCLEENCSSSSSSFNNFFHFSFSVLSQEPSLFDDHHSTTLSPTNNNPNDIISAPAVDFELNVQIQISSGSCHLYTHRDLISHSLSNNTTPTPIGSIILINKIEYQVCQFYLPGVDAHYNSKHTNTMNSALNKRASFYCRAMIHSPTTHMTIHPL